MMAEVKPAIIGAAFALMGFLGSDALDQRDKGAAMIEQRMTEDIAEIKQDLRELVSRIRLIETTVTTITAKGL